jgi:predicted amidophosphoribosyltransferase
MKNAFRVREKSLVQDKNILLIDDVITTGTTVRECSRELKKAGADTIHVIALAHGIKS